jgi:hypothetical protein
MNPIEILGSLLGQKAGGSGTGADILKEILLGGSKHEAPQSAPARTPREITEQEVDRQARELEELLNVASSRTSGRPTPQPQAQQQPPARQPGGWGEESPASRRMDSPLDDAALRQQEQAMTLIRAMVNAAKCDGQISQAEQQAILSKLENPSQEAIQFLRNEFSKPLDVREFAWSVPVGLEQQVYSMSLIAIDVDSDKEEKYLRELALGLRLKPEVCEQIKERLTGAGTRSAAAR